MKYRHDFNTYPQNRGLEMKYRYDFDTYPQNGGLEHEV